MRVGAAHVLERAVVLHEPGPRQHRQLLGGREGVGQVTRLVDEAHLGGPPPGDDAPVRDPLEIGRRERHPALHDDVSEARVELVHDPLQQRAVLLRHRLERRAHALVRARRDRLGAHADAAEPLRDVHRLDDDADRARDRRRLRDHAVGGAREVVAAGGRDLVHEDHDRLAAALLEPLQLAVHHLGGRDRSPRGVDPDDHRRHRRVRLGARQRLAEPGDGVLAVVEQPGRAGVGHQAGHVDQRDLGRRGAPAGALVLHHDRLGEAVVGGHDVDDEAHPAAAGERRGQEGPRPEGDHDAREGRSVLHGLL